MSLTDYHHQEHSFNELDHPWSGETLKDVYTGELYPLYRLEFRANKDRRPVNVYEDEDDTIIHVTLINSGVGFILLCSTFLYFFDSRQHMIEWRN